MFKFITFFKHKKKKHKWDYTHNFKKDKEGSFIIPVKVAKIDDLFSPYEINGYQIINSEYYAILEEMISNLPIKTKFNFSIEVGDKNIDKATLDMQKQKFAHAFKHHYFNNSLKTENKKKKNLLLAFLFLFLSLIVFASMYVIWRFGEDVSEIGGVWEIILVLGWVFSWEAFDRLTFGHADLIIRQIRNYHVYYSKISFTKSSKNSNLVKINNDDVLKSIKTFNKLYGEETNKNNTMETSKASSPTLNKKNNDN